MLFNKVIETFIYLFLQDTEQAEQLSFDELQRNSSNSSLGDHQRTLQLFKMSKYQQMVHRYRYTLLTEAYGMPWNVLIE